MICLLYIVHRAGEIAVRQRYGLRPPSRPGSVQDEGDVVGAGALDAFWGGAGEFALGFDVEDDLAEGGIVVAFCYCCIVFAGCADGWGV